MNKKGFLSHCMLLSMTQVNRKTLYWLKYLTLSPAPYFGMTFSNPQFKEVNHEIGDIIKKKIEEKYFKMELFWDFQCIE